LTAERRAGSAGDMVDVGILYKIKKAPLVVELLTIVTIS
jgi:hypothetical protein